MKRIVLLIFSGILLISTAKAQYGDDYLFNRSIGVQVGSQGIGLEFAHYLGTRTNLRLTANLLPLSYKTQKSFSSNYNYNLDAKLNLTNVSLIMDYQLFYYERGFKSKLYFSGGAAYFVNGKTTGTAMLADNYVYGDLVFTPEEVGEIRATADWKGPAVYAGLGFTGVPISNTINFGTNLGVYYLGRPETGLTSTNWLAGNERNAEILKDNLKSYKWLPNLQVTFSYKFN
ncbi:hypothetical protein [Pedobacter metabolipauper]|uniref:Outer membrane protein with beta-barrel domain n=1 Tax=Pedobacter metabolipauper TaxID=425513 RepID=A0A4R6SX38_9SPHI|nr:hypothetical protein [Pedobacter metabolipauper]TDQ09999.1 hypothetical protein ATK78_2158 [Pedobacter metabolipauper]